MDKITLDRSVFKALASDTRLDILKALDVRQKTVTELAKELELNKATVFEHLEKLAEVGLIQKLEDERKWVYWQLSWTGRRLLHPEKITLAILLSTAGGALVTAIAAVWLWSQSAIGEVTNEMGAFKADDSLQAPSSAESEPAATRSLAPPAEDATVAAPEPSHDPVFLAAAVAFGLIAILLVGWAARMMLRARAASEQPAG